MLTLNVVIWSPLLSFLVPFKLPSPDWSRLLLIRAPSSRSRAILPAFWRLCLIDALILDGYYCGANFFTTWRGVLLKREYWWSAFLIGNYVGVYLKWEESENSVLVKLLKTIEQKNDANGFLFMSPIREWERERKR